MTGSERVSGPENGTTMTAIHTACPYCGVGCGVVSKPDGTIAGDSTHPANRGRLCSKGAALGATLDEAGRLLKPTIGDSQRPGMTHWG